MIPSFVITGYLGSGKTTLLLNAAKEHFSNKRVAVIVNEIGEVGVDGKVLQNAYSEVIELPEGCICCSLHAEFEKALDEIRQKYNPEVLLVETSGAAEPFPIIISLQALGCSVDGVICIIDSANFDKYKNDTTAKYQIGNSNILVLNKIDLLNPEDLERVEKEVKETWQIYNPVNTFTGERFYNNFVLYKTTYGKLPKDVFSGAYTIKDLKGIAESHEHEHTQNQKVITFLEPLDFKEFDEKIKNLPKEVIRVKGIVRFRNVPVPLLVNYAFGNLDLSQEIPDYNGPSFLVLISTSQPVS
ncbi:MAG TPA: GTP-binding protein [Sulfurihydrogenibium azorense]|uniref:GTP-binding protein n=1 Tax=Sulfurihydrogenibium azorense TaxID=309806 RepID=A0A832DRQ0_9AQUI|nr:GTP-binding protein [Sulfurihydrogenibium azorense]